MIKALLHKDWRLCRSLLIATAALYTTPLVVGGIWLAVPTNTDHPQSFKEWLESAAYGLIMSAFVSCLVTPLYGAIMFARERRDRTAELVGAMPVPRGPIVFSKLIVLFILPILPWLMTFLGVFALYLVTLFGLQLEPTFGLKDVPQISGDWFLPAAILLSVGGGWFFSSFLSKDTVAAGLSFLVTVGSIVQIMIIWSKTHPENDRIPHGLLAATTGSMGLAFLIAGTMIALRRRTP